MFLQIFPLELNSIYKKHVLSLCFCTFTLLGILIIVNFGSLKSWIIMDFFGVSLVMTMKNYYKVSFVDDQLSTHWTCVIFGSFWQKWMKRTALVLMSTSKLKKKSVNLRAQNLERLVLMRSRERLTEKFFFFRVERLVNDAADLLIISINFFKSKFFRQTAIHNLLLDLTRSKNNICVTCTWHLKCRCNFCRA